MTQCAALFVDLSLNTLQPITFSHHGVKDLPMLARGVDAEGRPLRTVYLPAAQLRGRIRHEVALAELRARPEKVRLEDAYLLALGQELKPEEADEPEAVRLGELKRIRQENPFLDLFGTWKLASRLYVSHLLPEVNVQPDHVAHIRRDLDSNEALMDCLDEEEQDRFYDRQHKQGLASKAGTLIKQAEAELKAAKRARDTAAADALQAKIDELNQLKKARKGDDESDNTKHLVDLQVIPAGIELHGKITIQQAVPADVRFLLKALDGISQQPLFGAQRARGCGEIAGSATFREVHGQVLARVGLGGHQPARVEWTEAGRAWAEAAPAGAA